MTSSRDSLEALESFVPSGASWPPSRTCRVQHYFDSRGVARVYEMSFEDGIWKRWRWEISHDGQTWEHDFDLTYRKS